MGTIDKSKRLKLVIKSLNIKAKIKMQKFIKKR